MRIGAGRFKGRRLPAVRGARPVPARLKTSLFGVLAPHLPGARVLDLCAGVGGLGLEALSRGAAAVLLVERDGHAVGALNAWIREVGAEDEARAVRGDWVRGAPGGPYDLAFLDPPYAVWERDEIVAAGLGRLAAVLDPEALLVVKRPSHGGAWRWAGWALLRRVEVGSTIYELLRAAPASGADPDAGDADVKSTDPPADPPT